MKKKLYLALLVIAAAAQFGCGPKISDVIKKYQADYQKKRDQFKEIANSLPAKGSVNGNTPCGSLSPALEFNKKTKQYNTEMVMYDELLDPDASPKNNLLVNSDMLVSMQWTGPKNPLSPSVLGNSGADMEKTLKSALNYRYLVVNRITNIREPVAVDEKTFTPGQMSMESFVVDLSNNKPLCSFTASAQSAPDVSYSYKTNQSKKDQLEKFAYSTMWEEARKKLVDNLIQTTKGDVQLD